MSYLEYLASTNRNGISGDPGGQEQEQEQEQVQVQTTAKCGQSVLRGLAIEIALTLGLASILLTGCDTQPADTESSTNSVPALGAAPFVPTAAPSATSFPTLVSTLTVTPGVPGTGTPAVSVTPNYLTPMVATHEAYATRVRGNREALGTLVALTALPTDTPGLPPAYPSATPILGMLPGCGSASPYGPQSISCWRGVINGQLVTVGAGMEGLDGDPEQGIVRVQVEGDEDDDVYQTPQHVGAVTISSVSGSLFTLSTVGQATAQIFVFNLPTRQWVP